MLDESLERGRQLGGSAYGRETVGWRRGDSNDGCRGPQPELRTSNWICKGRDGLRAIRFFSYFFRLQREKWDGTEPEGDGKSICNSPTQAKRTGSPFT